MAQNGLTPTLKQKQFAREYVANGGNATQAVLQTYNADYNNSKVIASHNLDKPAVIQEIDKILTQLNMNTDSWVADRLKKAVDSGIEGKATVKDALQAMNMILKVNSSYPVNKSMKMNISLKGKLTEENTSQVIETVKSLSVKSTELIKDLSS